MISSQKNNFFVISYVKVMRHPSSLLRIATQTKVLYYEAQRHIRSNLLTSPLEKVDWEVVAKKSGYSNGSCAKTRFGQIKKRLGITDDGSSTGPSASGTTPIKPRAKSTIGSGTNKSASKVGKKSPGGNGKKNRFSKAEIAKACEDDIVKRDLSSKMNPGNEGIKEESEPGSYDEGHAENNFTNEGYDSDAGDDFYDAKDEDEI